jgi:F-type H+-transporting ATPase subunit a
MLPALDLLQPLSTTLAAGNPIEHVVDVKLVPLGSFGFWTMQLGTLLFAALVTILLLNTAANAIASGSGAGNKKYVTRGRLGQFVEVVVLGLRDQMLLPILGEKHTRKYLPFLLSMFFFILTINLLGLVPVLDLQHLFGIKATWIGGTATANIAVNAAFATVVFFVIQIHSVRELGLKGWFEHLCGGAELISGSKGLLLLVPIILVVEILGLFIKPAALCIRLFANMVGGHTLMATLLMFGAMARNPAAENQLGNWLTVGGISLLSGGFAVAIFFLEIFVSFLQAFIFMFLTSVFISQMSHHDEEHGHEGHGEHDHDAHGHEHGRPAHAH